MTSAKESVPPGWPEPAWVRALRLRMRRRSASRRRSSAMSRRSFFGVVCIGRILSKTALARPKQASKLGGVRGERVFEFDVNGIYVRRRGSGFIGRAGGNRKAYESRGNLIFRPERVDEGVKMAIGVRGERAAVHDARSRVEVVRESPEGAAA